MRAVGIRRAVQSEEAGFGVLCECEILIVVQPARGTDLLFQTAECACDPLAAGNRGLANDSAFCYGYPMSATIDLQQMSTPDKLRLMEDLWADLSCNEVSSPAWHGDVLAERDRLMESGEEKFVDWDAAKQQLRDELR